MTSGLTFHDGDHADRRPTVVVRAPQVPLDYLTVIQRSSTAGPDLKGIDHPRDPNLGLEKDGRWVLDYARAARCDEFLACSQHVGHLGDEWLTPLVQAWEDL